ncbi:MAG: glycoside hydrolase [Acidobacteria bacterium]|nr:glycoside hydrolase [Acidobacteriota bacterium]
MQKPTNRYGTVLFKSCMAFLLAFRLVSQAGAQGVADVRRGFENPPDDARIMMRWWWFGSAVTKAEIERELRTMKTGGIGGVEVQPVYPLLPDDPKTGFKNLPYLSDEFIDMLRFAAAKSKELGMRFDLTLGSGWSFGGAKTPITEAAGQLRVERVKVEGSTKQVPVPAMIPAEKLLAVFLSTATGGTVTVKDLTELRQVNDGVVLLTPRTGEAEVLFFISGKSGMQVKRPSFGAEGYVLNHLDRPSVDNYLKLTGDRLFTAFDRTTIPYSVFCDSLEVYNQDWTDGFLEEFQKRRGYDLTPFLPALAMDLGPATADIRYDWGRTITELFNERFMVPMQEWSKKNGTKFRIQGYGLPPAAISSNKWADISDGEGAQWKVVRAARWASSANHIYGRKVTSSETWTWLHSPVFRATPLDIKAEADVHFLQGINQLIGHGWAYTPPEVEYPGWRFYAAGEYSDRNPWWIVMPDLARYLQRMSFLMRQGEPRNDVAFYLPNADAYSHFTAGRVHLIEAERELVGETILPAIISSGFNLDFFDDTILTEIGSIQSKELVLGSSRHRAIVVPGVERMPLESLRKLESFAKAGGAVVFARRLPSVVPGFSATQAQQEELKTAVQRLIGGTYPNVKFVRTDEEVGKVLAQLVQPDAAISPSGEDFGSVHRKIDGGDLYFVANTSNQRRSVKVTFRASGKRVEVLNALTGKIDVISSQTVGNSTTVALDFEPYGSNVVVISNGPATNAFNAPSTEGRILDLSSGWSLAFKDSQPVKVDKLISWTEDESRRLYSGVAEYIKTLEIPAAAQRQTKSIMLDFGEGKPLEVQAMRNGMRAWLDPPVREAAVVYVNGNRAGSVWCPPYSLEIGSLLKPGTNEIKIMVANTALNYMAGRKLPDYKLLNLRYGERFQPQDMDKIGSLPSGLIGPVRLIMMK